MVTGYNHFWQKTPFSKILIPLIIGICIANYFHIEEVVLLDVAIGLFIVSVGFNLLLKRLNRHTKLINALLLNALIMMMGMILVQHKLITNKTNWYGNYNDTSAGFIAQVIDVPIEKPNSFQVLINIVQQKSEAENTEVVGKAILYVQKSGKIDSLYPGSIIGFSKHLSAIKNSGNPYAFDYKKFQQYKGITHQQYILSDEYAILKQSKLSIVDRIINFSKNKIQSIFSTYFYKTTSYAMSMALLLGDKTDLDSNIYQSFVNTGIVHVIAVSGMHLGLIFAIFAIILKPIRRVNKWLYLVLVFILIWGFCLLAGSAASIVRAAAMVTVYVLGDVLGRQKNKYNPIFIAAFLLLCYNPFWLWDVGFQLSFAAVLSILIFYQPIYNIIQSKNKTLNYVLKMIAVTLAAQILTTPIAVFHFQQFPVYFLLANLVAVPLTNGLLILLVVFLMFHSVVPILNEYFVFLIQVGFSMLTKFIFFIEKLPNALIHSIYISAGQLWLLFIAIGSFSYFLFRKRKPYLYLSLVALLCFSTIRFFDYAKKEKQNFLIVYNVAKKSRIGFVKGSTAHFYGDSLSTKEYQYNLQPSLSYFRSKIIATIKNNLAINLIRYSNKKIVLIDSINKNWSVLAEPIQVDIAVITGNKKLYISQLVKFVHPKMIVVDASIPAWRKQYWKNDCEALSIPFYDTEESGAFVMRIG